MASRSKISSIINKFLSTNREKKSPTHIPTQTQGLFPKAKYLAQKKIDKTDSPMSPGLKSRFFGPIEELKNENSQNNIEEFNESQEQKQEQESRMNIFAADQNHDPGYYDKFVGPRFDSAGNLIKHSIIGKADRFLRKYNQSADYRKGYDSRASLYSPKNSSHSLVEPDIPSRTDAAFLRRSNSKKTTLISVVNAVTTMTKIVPKRNLIRMNRNQVNYEIKKVEERIQQNSINDQMLMQTLKPKDQLYLTKEERIFKKKQQDENLWRSQLNLLRQKVPRSKSEHLIETSEDFRYMKEKAQMIDLLKTDQEKYGNKYWYYSIRNNLQEELKNLGVGLENLKAFSKSFLNLKNNQVEFIRGHSMKDKRQKQKVMNIINVRNDEKDEYLTKILRENHRKINIIQPVDTVETGVNGFEIKGENKFIIEKNALENLTQTYDNFCKEKQDKKEEEKQPTEEIIAENYTAKELFSKTGSNLFPKIASTFSFSH